jgi:hypothetical protein
VTFRRFTYLGMLWLNWPSMPEEWWVNGGDVKGPCVNPLIDGIVCDEAIE